MNLRSIFSLSAMTGLGLAATAILGMWSGAAHTQTAKDLVGTWQMSANVNTAADGTKSDAYGPHGIGSAIFESNGRFAIVIINPDVPKFTSNNRAQGTPDENKAVVTGSLAYFGTYSIADKVVTMKVDGSTYPNSRGTDEKLTIISLTGDDLKWALAVSQGGQNQSTWKRIK
jgi:hypothetical protein